MAYKRKVTNSHAERWSDTSSLSTEIRRYLKVADGPAYLETRYTWLVPPEHGRDHFQIAHLILFFRQAAAIVREGGSTDQIRKLANTEWQCEIDDSTWECLLYYSPWTMVVERKAVIEARKKGRPYLWARAMWFSYENLGTVNEWLVS